MVVSSDIEAQILRYHHVERWPVGTIATQLKIHHDVVRRVLERGGGVLPRTVIRPSLIDPYRPFVVQTLEKFPRLTATRIYAMVRERGYQGGVDHFRRTVGTLRPHPSVEAFQRLRTLPGEQGQVDWGHFGHVEIGRAKRPLMAFVMVLSYSRQIFLRFYLDARMENFLRGHASAFDIWQGVPRVVLYDNLKSAVLERRGDAIRFNPALLSFAAHYRYEPRPVAVARGNEKGRVERAIRYVRDAFFAAREFNGLDDLNRQAEAWCNGMAADRRCPGEPDRTVRTVFADEAPRLLKLPDNPLPLHERVEVKVGKTPYVRFDLNDYSVPHDHARRTLTVLADPHELRIVDGTQVLATHRRSYDKGAQIEDAAHIKRLAEQKHAARQHRGTDRLLQAVPAAQDLLVRAAERGANIGGITVALLRLLDQYGAAEMTIAVREALARGVPHHNAVLFALECRRQDRGEPPPIEIDLPSHVKDRDQPVTTHALDTYDQLTEAGDE
jgi:transposase